MLKVILSICLKWGIVARSLVIIYHPDFKLHLTGEGHPECVERMDVILDGLQQQGLMHAENRMLAEPVPLSAVSSCHQESYIDLVHKECLRVKQKGIPPGHCMLSTGDVFISPNSYAVALLAAGAGIVAVDQVMKGLTRTAFCVIRPPGHHATSSQGMGFCFFNNAAIAARYAQKTFGIKRVLIVDWDVHHGNGTQEIFYSDPSVFYFSTHQDGIYPGTGHRQEVGVGNILNFPIAGGKNSRLQVLKAFEEDLPLAMERFKPELVLISAGFDGHKKDPLGGFDLETKDFARLTVVVQKIASQYCQGRIVSLLEGGYNLEALAESVCAHVHVLQGY